MTEHTGTVTDAERVEPVSEFLADAGIGADIRLTVEGEYADGRAVETFEQQIEIDDEETLEDLVGTDDPSETVGMTVRVRDAEGKSQGTRWDLVGVED